MFQIFDHFLHYGFIPSLLEAQAAHDQRKTANLFNNVLESLSSVTSVEADDEYLDAQK